MSKTARNENLPSISNETLNVLKVRPEDAGGTCAQYLRATVIVNFIILCGAVFWPLFSMGPYGYGEIVYLKLASGSYAFYPLGIGAAILLILLALLDVGYWVGRMYYVGRFLILLDVVLWAFTALSATAFFAGADIAVYLCCCVAFVFIIKTAFLPGMTNLTFLWWSAFGLALVSMISGTGWLVWVLRDQHGWNTELKTDYYVRLECVSGSTIYAMDEVAREAYLDEIDKESKCNQAKLIWLNPLILTIWCFVLSTLLFFAVRAEERSFNSKTRFDTQTQVFIVILILGLMGMWAGAQISGSEIGLATDVFVFCFLGLMVAGLGIVLMSGTDRVVEGIKSVSMVQRVVVMASSDAARGLLLFVFFPLLIVLVPLSFIRQVGRKHLPFTKTLTAEEKKLYLTTDLSVFLSRARAKWHWTMILTRAIQWGLLFVTIVVVIHRFFPLFFSWLNHWFVVNNLRTLEVTLIFYTICWVLIMQPPTPGMPLFLASAIILIPVCVRDGWDFWAAWVFSTFISVLIKTTGLLGAQALGHVWGMKSVTIRRLVGINSIEMKAIRFILKDFKSPVPTWGQVGIMLGGPDWPVGVIAGLLRTSYLKNQISTLPIVFMILPITLTGACWLKISEGGLWASASAIFLALAILTQTLSMVVAVFAIERVINTHRAELEAYPVDEEVKRLDEIALQKSKVRRHISQWRYLPFWLKSLMITGFLFELAACFAFELQGSKCFYAFKLTDSIEETLDGRAINIVKDPGWVALGLALYPIVVLFVLSRWIDFMVWYRPDIQPPTEDLSTTPVNSNQQVESKMDPMDVARDIYS